MNRWKIGDVTITRVVESETATDLSMLLPDATPENIRKEEWLRPHFADDNGRRQAEHPRLCNRIRRPQNYRRYLRR